ncbi:MAG: hypothetical protein ACJAQ1_000142 [Flavobacterium sp.]|jgi:hypothetical protein
MIKGIYFGLVIVILIRKRLIKPFIRQTFLRKNMILIAEFGIPWNKK